MSNVYEDRRLSAYTRILRSRIAHLGLVDFNFMHSHEAERPTSYNDHFGRFVGWFVTTKDRPGILLLARQNIGGPISHAFLFYVNSIHNEFPLEERRYLSLKLPEEPKLCICNVKATLAQFCEVSILLEAMYYITSVDLFGQRSSMIMKFIGGNYPPVPEEFEGAKVCKHDSMPEALDFVGLTRRQNLLFVDIDQSGPLSRFFSILRIKLDDHYIYAINYQEEEAALILVPRIAQMPSTIHFEVARDRIDQKFPDMFKNYYAVRFRIDADCSGLEMLAVCILLAHVPLLYVDTSDLLLTIEDLENLSIGGSRNSQSQRSGSQSQEVDPAYERRIPEANVNLIMSPSWRTRRPGILSMRNNDLPQEEPIRTQQLVRREVEAYRAWMAVADDTRELYPSCLRVVARSCPEGTILKNLKWLQEQLAIVAFTWERYATTKVLQCQILTEIGRRHIEDKPERFIILPIRRHVTEESCGLMIFDKERKEWAWIHPDNKLQGSKDLVQEVKYRVLECGPRYAEWKGHIIIISSSYHKDFAYVHLVLALYYTAKLFAYAVQLPQKVVYNEQAFRLYAYHQCLALQVANQEYNLRHDLIDEFGEPKVGAFISLPSPVQYERAVVPSDICGFCKKRGFGNLGRHMSMAHGGQAQNANILRRIQYGFTSRH